MTAFRTNTAPRRHPHRILRCAAVVAILAAAPVCAQPLDNFAAAGAESRLELGRLALEQGELENAQRLVREAVQLLKIDKGLRTQTQLEPLRRLMWAEMRAAQWSELETSLEHFYWLLGQIQDSTLSSQLAIIRDLRQLNLEAAAHPNNPAPAKHFSGAQRLNWQALNFIEATVGEDSPRLVPWLYDGLLLQHLENRLLDKRGLSNYQYKTDGREIVSGWSLSGGEISRASYAIGVDLLDRIEAICLSKSSSSDERALISSVAKLYGGDWAMLNERSDLAASYYAQAEALWPKNQTPPATLETGVSDLRQLPRESFTLSSIEIIEATKPTEAHWLDGFNNVRPSLLVALNTSTPSSHFSCVKH